MNELVTTFGTDEFDRIAELTGAFTGTASFLPLLKLNTEAFSEKVNPATEEPYSVPVGTYMIVQDGTRIYAKSAKFRAFMNTYQYITYDASAGKFTNKSIIIKNFNEDAIDELGGVKCGKSTRKEFEELQAKGLLSAEEIKKWTNTTCNRGLYGLVTFDDAVTETGEKTSVENLPVLWRTSRSNFNAAKNALDAITKMKHLYFQHWLQLDKPKREKNGSVVYYIINVEPILDREVEFTAEDMATFKMFQEQIDRENKAIAAKWREAKKQVEPFNFDKSALAELELNDDVSDL